MSEQELVLSVRHVTSGYRDRGLFRRGPYQEVLRDVTFDVRHGEILVWWASPVPENPPWPGPSWVL